MYVSLMETGMAVKRTMRMWKAMEGNRRSLWGGTCGSMKEGGGKVICVTIMHFYHLYVMYIVSQWLSMASMNAEEGKK